LPGVQLVTSIINIVTDHRLPLALGAWGIFVATGEN
jgi:hypothetical protein